MTNADISKIVDTTDEWIVERTGIKARHIAAEDETTRSLAVQAARKALEHARLTPADIDLVIVATSTPDSTFPATATQVQADLGITRGAAFDVQAVCSGFVYGLTIADNFIRGGQSQCALVIGSETFSRILDWNDRATCVLFGDGAGQLSCVPGKVPAPMRIVASSAAIFIRWPLLRQALCRWRAFNHQDRGAPAHGGPRGLQARRDQHCGRHG